MYRTWLIVFVVWLLAGRTNDATAQWRQTSGPSDGGNVRVAAMARLDSTIFLSAFGDGVYRSSVGGREWSKVEGDPTSAFISTMLVVGDTLYAGTWGSGVLSTGDKGRSWYRLNNGLGNRYVTSLVAWSGVLFAGTSGGGVYRSQNGGKVWGSANEGLSDGNVVGLAILRGALYAGTDSGGIFASIDTGRTWTAQNNGLNYLSISTIAASDRRLFVGTRSGTVGGGLFASNGVGAAWSIAHSGLANTNVSILCMGDSGMIVGFSPGGMKLLRDSSSSFSTVSLGLTALAVSSVLFTPSYTYVGTTNSGILVGSGSDSLWRPSNFGLGFSSISSLLSDSLGVLAGTEGGSVLRYDPSSDKWSGTPVAPPNSAITSLLVHRGGVFAADNLDVFYSSDRGRTWETRSSGISPRVSASIPEDRRFLASLDSNLFYASSVGIFKSTNLGVRWTRVYPGLSTFPLSFLESKGTLLLCTPDGILASADTGRTWRSAAAPSSHDNIWAVTTMGDVVIGATMGFGFFRSDDSGKTWVKIVASQPTLRLWAESIDNVRGVLFAGTWDGVYISPDTGRSWSAINTGLVERTRSLAHDGMFLYAGTSGRGVWRRPISDVVSDVDKDAPGLPSQLALVQNYPNPFNAATHIIFEIRSTTHVRLEVFNVLGESITVLVDGVVAAGRHSALFERSDKPTGVYYYRLTTQAASATRSMVLVR